MFKIEEIDITYENKVNRWDKNREKISLRYFKGIKCLFYNVLDVNITAMLYTKILQLEFLKHAL